MLLTVPRQARMPASWWLPFVSFPVGVRRAAYVCAGVAGFACRGWRWAPAALAAGAGPFLLSWATGVPGHQAVSAAALCLLCLGFARDDRWKAAICAMALACLAHCAVVIGAAHADARGTSAVLPQAEDYWQRQLVWISTGRDPEYELTNWVPAHFQLAGGTVLYSYTSLGGVALYEGLKEADMMNYYSARLMCVSRSQAVAVGLGWHLWSILRGIGFLFITYEVASLSLERLTGTRLSTRRRRGLRWSVGLAFLLADGLVKAAMLGPVRDGLYHNLLTAL